jgi:hypothetical protein
VTRVTVWSREGCGLCAELLDELLPWAVAHGVGVDVRDLDAADAATQRRYVLEIPVVLHEGAPVCRGHLDLAALERRLAAAAQPGAQDDGDGAAPVRGARIPD